MFVITIWYFIDRLKKTAETETGWILCIGTHAFSYFFSDIECKDGILGKTHLQNCKIAEFALYLGLKLLAISAHHF